MAKERARLYYRLIDAQILGEPFGLAVKLLVTLKPKPNCVPDTECLVFPIKSLKNYGIDNMWASEWVIGVKNKWLAAKGQSRLNIDPMPKNFVE